MKIGIISKFLPERDGIAIYTENLSKNLKNVEIIRIGTRKSKADYTINFDSLDFHKELKKIINQENLDILHFQYIAPWYGRFTLNYPIIKALKKIKIPKIVTLHEVQYKAKGLKTKLLRFIEKKIVKYADRIITHTDQQAEFINKRYYTEKASRIYMGIHLKTHTPIKGKNLLLFGMLSEGKGIIDLIKAREFIPNYQLKIAGRAVTKEYKEKILNAKKNKDIETKLGWISEEEKDILYRWANIVVLPYRWAPYQSAVLHDALSYSLPVVVTKVGAVWEIVDKFKCGVIAKSGNPESIAMGIKKLFLDYDHYRKGIEKYKKEANWLENGKKHIKLYETTLKSCK